MQIYLPRVDLFMTDQVRARLSEILKTAMGDRTQRSFAKDLGVSHVALRSWIECEGFPVQGNLEKIAGALGMGLEEFLQELRGDHLADISPKKAEDLLAMANNLSDAEAFRLATLLFERVKGAIAKKL